MGKDWQLIKGHQAVLVDTVESPPAKLILLFSDLGCPLSRGEKACFERKLERPVTKTQQNAAPASCSYEEDIASFENICALRPEYEKDAMHRKAVRVTVLSWVSTCPTCGLPNMAATTFWLSARP